ncbi:hypothetical protein PROSTU_00551 [Providencia stuartii ATCC 25827]|uniref:Uncharacterized protein n=1 Tax=Providencia stuartii ATCC 25827 TaxID=471874 RepID=A0AA86YW09_PROST|nr:hypothetical protein PROSTU_00551 [Providencia stuartii ATCC 25827]
MNLQERYNLNFQSCSQLEQATSILVCNSYALWVGRAKLHD